jgi:hypothetical protein
VAARTSFVDAMHLTSLAGVAVAVAGAAVALAFLPSRPAGEAGDLFDLEVVAAAGHQPALEAA